MKTGFFIIMKIIFRNVICFLTSPDYYPLYRLFHFPTFMICPQLGTRAVVIVKLVLAVEPDDHPIEIKYSKSNFKILIISPSF